MVPLITLLLAFDLTSVRQEENLEKRSDQALEFADTAVDAARDAYTEGRWEATQGAIGDVNTAVQLSYDSLIASGKDPRDDSKHFKRAEMATRQLLRRLRSFKSTMSSVDHEIIDPVIDNVNTVHENLVTGIMTGEALPPEALQPPSQAETSQADALQP